MYVEVLQQQLKKKGGSTAVVVLVFRVGPTDRRENNYCWPGEPGGSNGDQRARRGEAMLPTPEDQTK